MIATFLGDRRGAGREATTDSRIAIGLGIGGSGGGETEAAVAFEALLGGLRHDEVRAAALDVVPDVHQHVILRQDETIEMVGMTVGGRREEILIHVTQGEQ